MKTLIGKKAQLIEMPDGYTSKDYDVELNEVYPIIDVEGSNIWIQTKTRKASINISRFKIVE